MNRKAAVALVALVLGGAFVLASTPASAQQQEQKQQQGKARGGGGGTHAIAPRGGNRTVAPRSNRSVSHRTSTPRTMTQRRVRTVTPHTMTQRKMRTSTPRVATERKMRGTANTRKIATPRADKRNVVDGGKMRRPPLRGISRMHAGTRNFSVWRGKHRVRHNNGWRTFVAIGALSAIAYGDNDYYPYAYISADEPYCSGLTDEGCQLHWREVETVEGDVIDQCVAYCPWR
jgi:hypothetical protein